MSWLSSGLKKVGGVAKKAAPFVGLIPGAGTVAGGLLGGLGSLASGDNIGEAIGYGAKGALGGYLGSAALGGKGIGGLLGGGLKKVGGAVAGSGGGGLGGLVGGLGGAIGSGIKALGGTDALLGGGALAMGAYQQKQAGDMRNKALRLIEQDYASRAPLRQAGLQGMLNEQRPDLSSTFAPAGQNPFAMRRVG